MNALFELIGLIFALIVLFFARKEIEEKFPDTIEMEDPREVIDVYCEKIDGIHYAWLKKPNQFIGQSKSPDELANLLMTKYPLKKYKLNIEEKVT